MNMRLNSDWTPQVCWPPIGIYRHVSLQWRMLVSDGACLFSMGHVSL